MPSKVQQTGIRIQPDLMKKFRYIAAYNGRSFNKEIEQLMRKWVNAFERENGPIEIEHEDEE